MSRVTVMKKTKTITRYDTASGRACYPKVLILSSSYNKCCNVSVPCPPITSNTVLDGGLPNTTSTCIIDGGDPGTQGGDVFDGGNL